MIGIYKITNLLNGKIYVGQSNDIQRRFLEHQTKGKKSRIPLDIAIQRYGKENFSYEILEECKIEELNKKETYWIKKLNSVELGYNCNYGGQTFLIGENNPNSKLSKEDVVEIRQAYAAHKKQKDVYEKYKNKIAWSSFQTVWQGKTWVDIMPEVFSEENKAYYMKKVTFGEKSSTAILTDEEVIQIRNRYVNETAKQIYADYKDKIEYQTFQQILWGRTYKHLPIYKKKNKTWNK